MKLAIEGGNSQQYRCDIAKSSWALSPAAFQSINAVSLKAKFRADLLRSAAEIGFNNVPDIDGFVIALLHGELTHFPEVARLRLDELDRVADLGAQ